jgi:hypothetical protein
MRNRFALASGNPRSARKTCKSLALMHQDDPRTIVVYRAVPPLLQKTR